MKHNFQPISAELMDFNPFKEIGDNWMLITAGNEEKANTMTASWGGLGVMWGKNVAYVVIRQTRYTKEFVDREGKFSLSFLGDHHKSVLKYLGKVSGRTEDKIKEAGITLDYKDGVPYIDEAQTVLICKVMSSQVIDPKCMNDTELAKQVYGDNDYHTMYIAEITDILAR